VPGLDLTALYIVKALKELERERARPEKLSPLTPELAALKRVLGAPEKLN